MLHYKLRWVCSHAKIVAIFCQILFETYDRNKRVDFSKRMGLGVVNITEERSVHKNSESCNIQLGS